MAFGILSLHNHKLFCVFIFFVLHDILQHKLLYNSEVKEKLNMILHFLEIKINKINVNHAKKNCPPILIDSESTHLCQGSSVYPPPPRR